MAVFASSNGPLQALKEDDEVAQRTKNIVEMMSGDKEERVEANKAKRTGLLERIKAKQLLAKATSYEKAKQQLQVLRSEVTTSPDCVMSVASKQVRAPSP